jgi:DNA-binding response OmpR family regulator
MTKILMVETEELVSNMLEFNFKKAGFEVESYNDAEAMLSSIDGCYPDIILMDMMLPGVSGYSALRKLRERGIKTPIIIMGAKNDIETKMKCFDCGGDDYLLKPFNVKELLARTKAIIRRSQGDPINPGKNQPLNSAK